ncbi:hypothetical protein [Commensalibacter papalotli (ex Servin-Garciduenas et al. 2014)]|uniref:hypothetical protein n=1 Tax=Commensalibacter papalotli (ex Servin-Garciduenas et al. 2014) TaxID=1208583 RepID=UPI001377BD08|nr:hypothetical protein [Commensalibacter papalotli (ex Servin-Garciduenas et al. 2014)]
MTRSWNTYSHGWYYPRVMQPDPFHITFPPPTQDFKEILNFSLSPSIFWKARRD